MRASADTEWARTPGRRFSAATVRLAAAALLTMLVSIGGGVWLVTVFSEGRPNPVALSVVSALAAAWLAGGLIALVPRVERSLLRRFVGLRDPTGDERRRLEPVFARVCQRAREDPGQFSLLVEPSELPNASAVGYSLVAVTEAALTALPDDQLEAVLAHELGHQDAWHSAAVFQSYWWSRPWALAMALTRGAFGCSFQVGCFLLLILVPLLLPGLIAILIQAAASRYSELEADRFAVDLGYGPALSAALSQLEVRLRDAEVLALAQRLRREGATDAQIREALERRQRRAEEGRGILSSHPATRRRLTQIESRMRGVVAAD